jgi:hypothetical protein
MKKTYATSKKASSAVGYNVHLRPFGKKLANKSTRKIAKKAIAAGGEK